MISIRNVIITLNIELKSIQDILEKKKLDLKSINHIINALDDKFGNEIIRYRQIQHKEKIGENKNIDNQYQYDGEKLEKLEKVVVTPRMKYLTSLNLVQKTNFPTEIKDINHYDEVLNLFLSDSLDDNKNNSHINTIDGDFMITQTFNELNNVANSIDNAKHSQQLAWEQLELAIIKRERIHLTLSGSSRAVKKPLK